MVICAVCFFCLKCLDVVRSWRRSEQSVLRATCSEPAALRAWQLQVRYILKTFHFQKEFSFVFLEHSFPCTFFSLHILFLAHPFLCTSFSLHILFLAHPFPFTIHVLFLAHSFPCTFFPLHILFPAHHYPCTYFPCRYFSLHTLFLAHPSFHILVSSRHLCLVTSHELILHTGPPSH